MASRGARARKVTEKQIQKTEQKHVDKDRAERFARMHSPVGDMRPTSPMSSPTFHAPWSSKKSVLSSSASITSGGSDGSGFSSNQESRGISSKISSAGSDEKKFARKGKVTNAPRGRGGGVPPKLAQAQAMAMRSDSHSFTNRTRAPSASSGSQTPSQPMSFERSWQKTKLWVGKGQSPKPYLGFEHDEDMWMADGNCLIFFSEETDEEDPRPMLRVHSSMLESARSTFMINLLKYGEIVPEEEPATAGRTQSSASLWPLNSKSLGNLDELLSDSHSRPNQHDNDFRPPRTAETSTRDTWSTSDHTAWSPGNHEQRNRDGSFRIPPSVADSVTVVSGAGSDIGDTPSGTPGGPVEITHEIWFRAPSHIKRPDIQRRHHMATRNYLALLYGLPIIGNDFYEMMSDLQNVMDTYYELNEPSERWNSAQVMVQYLSQLQLDDVRGNLPHALGLLAWSEQPNVLWDAGYLEGFVHAVGMMTQQTLKIREYRNLTQVTRHKLQNTYNAMQLKLIEAEERLNRFDFPEFFYVDGVATGHPTQKGFEHFRQFLHSFYESECHGWPPREEDHQGHWLTRGLMLRLQSDFGSIYNYWVDRDIAWDANENRATRKWEMVCSKLRAEGFQADNPGLPITDMLIGFDSSQKYGHIPHPYPLLPVSRSPSPKPQSSRKTFLSKFKSKDKESHVPDVKAQYQMALAFNNASNINRLSTTNEDNKLVDDLGNYEKCCLLPGVTPSDARLGRWILLYGILQVLSTISVDTGGLKYKDKIKYFISPSLEGCPPWRSPDAAPLMIEASQENSFCWLAPQTWGDTALKTPPAYSTHQYESRESTPTELDERVASRNGDGLPNSTGRPSPLLGPPSNLSLAASARFRSQENLKPNVPMKNPSRVSPALSSTSESYT
ncbi:hypothetical protein EJ08DRAFT_655180 [Tothia fuscella]|uniref:DUF8004 domain-containing protein n=1 Tax=Tothia fuscella TaxID=1048955 RepID=A0A9P4P2F1_9PEZI|nr:hypothetical protein EJ08DRAFT_655180 [Tothia fuscella]